MNKTAFYEIVPRDAVAALIERVETPCYLYFPTILDRQVQRLRESLGGRFSLHYAVKANPHPRLLGRLAELGVGADVASGGELRAVLDAGIPAGEVEYSGPGKTLAELGAAIEAGIGSINVESVEEIDLIAKLAAERSRHAHVGVRINPGKPKGRSGMRMAGDTQFGIALEQVPEAFRRIEAQADVLAYTGIHAHTQSQELDSDAIVENIARTLEIAVDLAPRIGQPLRKINFGGGLGIDYFAGQSPLDLERLGEQLIELLDESRFAALVRDVSLKLEPGRFITGECGLFATRVLYRKGGPSRQYAIVDGGMNANYVLAGGMGQVIRRNFELDFFGEGRERPAETFKLDVAGPLCTPQDVLASGVDCEHEVRVGDAVVFFNCGAYGPSASPLEFLSHDRPAELFADDLSP